MKKFVLILFFFNIAMKKQKADEAQDVSFNVWTKRVSLISVDTKENQLSQHFTLSIKSGITLVNDIVTEVEVWGQSLKNPIFLGKHGALHATSLPCLRLSVRMDQPNTGQWRRTELKSPCSYPAMRMMSKNTNGAE